MTDKPYSRTVSQKIQDEVRNKELHQDIAWRNNAPQTMRELLDLQAQAIERNERNDKS
jgi:hypothetical protein